MIVNEDVDGRMLRLIQQYYAAGYPLRYCYLTNLLVFEWLSQGGTYTNKSVCRLDAWFTEAAQDYIIDLIYPRI